MKESPLVSILIPVYNREHLIAETVNSAIAQTYSKIEIIIFDNKSTDKTWEILKDLANQDERIKIFQNKVNVGPVKNWIKCVEKASGVYTKILFSDDLITPTFLEKTLPLFDSETAFILTGIQYFGDVSSKSYFQDKYPIIQPTNKYIKESIVNYYTSSSYPVSPSCAIFRTKDVKKNLIVDIENNDYLNFNKFGAGNDLLLFLLTAKEYKFVKTVKSLESLFRSHSSSFSIANNLLLYYDWVRNNFINSYRKDLIKQFSVIGNFHKKRNYPESNLKFESLSINSLKHFLSFSFRRLHIKYKLSNWL